MHVCRCMLDCRLGVEMTVGKAVYLSGLNVAGVWNLIVKLKLNYE